MACKPKSQLRAADGMELTHRFGKQTLRMLDGGDTMPQNRVPMSEQDQGAFNSLQNTPTGSIVEPAAAPAAKTDVRERMLAAGQRTQTFQPMMNNIAQQPVLAPRPMMLRDGGEVSPWSLKGMAGAVSKAFADTPEQARQKALVAQYKAEKAAAPAPVASAPAPTAGIQGYVANGALARREAAAGLRDGGTVPGKGTGDKIPALYEPGEFVVSNDMLDAAPGLREGLHDLRGNVLAAKGKTVEEADAQAVRGGALRAASGGALPELPSLDFLDKRPAPAPAPIQAALRTPAQVPVVRSAIADAMERAVSKHPMGWQAAPAAPNFETLPGAAGPNNSIKFAVPPEPINATTSLGANTAEARGMTRTAPAPNLTAMNQPGIDTRNAQYAERAAYEAQAAREANPRSMTVKELFTSKDGSVRGNNPLRFNPPGMGPNGVTRPAALPRSMTRAELFSQPPSGIPNNPNGPLKLAPPVGSEPVGRLAKGLHWADDALSAAAKSKFVAPLLGAINSPVGQMVGKLGGVGAQFALHHGDAGAPTLDAERVAAMGRPYDPDWQPGAEGKPYVPRPDSVEPWGNETRRNSPMAGVTAPTAPVRGVENFTKALRDVPNQLPAGLRDGMVYKTKGANGETVYSGRNVTGDVSNRMLNGDGTSAGPMRGSLRVASGAPTFGPNGSFVIDDQAPTGAAKQAQINATLRNPDGTQWTARDNAVMAANLRDGVDPYRGTSRAPVQSEDDNIPAIGEFGHNRAVAAKAERDRLKATLRGQDIQSADSRYGHELSSEVSRNRLRYDMNKDQRDFRTGRSDKMFEKSQAADKAWTEHANTMFRTTDDKGNVVPDTAKAAEYTQFVDQGIGQLIPMLEQSGEPKFVEYVQRLKTEGRAALDAQDRAELATLFGRQQVHAQTIGSGPFSSGGAVSTNPYDYRITGNANGIFQERVKTKGGQTIPTTNLLYGPKANRFLWNTGEGSTALMPNKLRGE